MSTSQAGAAKLNTNSSLNVLALLYFDAARKLVTFVRWLVLVIPSNLVLVIPIFRLFRPNQNGFTGSTGMA